jgi:hypothetical protein
LARTPLIVDCSKAVRELGLPQRPIAGALGDAITWLEDQGLVTRRSSTLIDAAQAIADQ